jgi:hypothetical protein
VEGGDVPTPTVQHKILATPLMFNCQAPNIPRISKQFNLISIVMGNRIVTETEPNGQKLVTEHSGVARICIWRGLARPEAPKAPEAVLGVGPGGGSPPPGRGFGGITPEKILEI